MYYAYKIYIHFRPPIPKIVFDYQIDNRLIQVLKVEPGALGENKLLLMIDGKRVSMIGEYPNSLKSISVDQNSVSLETADTLVVYEF